MTKKNHSRGKKILILLLFVLNIISALLLLGAFLSSFITPEWTSIFLYCGLIFPYILIINIFFTLFWVFVRYRYLFISLIIILLNVNNVDRYYQLNGRAKPANIANSIKVMSYNVQLFGLYSSSHHAEQLRVRDAEMSFLRAQQPDILCLQEYFYDKTGTLDFNTRDSLLSLMGLSRKSSKEQSNYYVTLFPASTRNNYQAGEAIFSKYKIVRSGAVPLPDTNTYNGSLFADIKYKHDTIRVYCIHLESFKMSEADYEIGKEWSEGNFNDPAFNKKAYHLSEKVAVASRERAKQVKMIRAHVKQSPYPVIICGDFNDTPVSYSYYQLCRGLDDSFRRSGKGAGITYRGDAFPNYRIDYILHSSKYNAYEHTVCTSIATSDHFPVYTYLSLKKR